MTIQRKKEYIIFIGICILFFLMLPKVCAQNSISPEKAAEMREKLITYSKEHLGCPYRSGSNGPATFDCSGFVFSMYRESTGIQLPRTSSAIYSKAKKIEKKDLEKGDLVFFKTTSSGKISHVGIYIEDDKFIHSASDGPETGVIISKLNSGYWKKTYFASGRYLPELPKIEVAQKNE